jgi:hypothetical protein
MKRAIFLLLLVTFAAFAQVESTTLSVAIPSPNQPNLDRYDIYLASCQYVKAPGQATAPGGIELPSGANYYLLLIDSEFFKVNAVNANTSPCEVTVERGVQGSAEMAHSAGTTVYTAPASLFGYYPPYQNGPETKKGNTPKESLLVIIPGLLVVAFFGFLTWLVISGNKTKA